MPSFIPQYSPCKLPGHLSRLSITAISPIPTVPVYHLHSVPQPQSSSFLGSRSASLHLHPNLHLSHLHRPNISKTQTNHPEPYFPESSAPTTTPSNLYDRDNHQRHHHHHHHRNNKRGDSRSIRRGAERDASLNTEFQSRNYKSYGYEPHHHPSAFRSPTDLGQVTHPQSQVSDRAGNNVDHFFEFEDSDLDDSDHGQFSSDMKLGDASTSQPKGSGADNWVRDQDRDRFNHQHRDNPDLRSKQLEHHQDLELSPPYRATHSMTSVREHDSEDLEQERIKMAFQAMASITEHDDPSKLFRAQALFRSIQKPTPKLITEMIRAASKCRKPHIGLNIYLKCRQKNLDLSPQVYFAAMRCSGLLRNSRHVMDRFQEMQQAGMRMGITEYGACIMSLQKAGDWEQALNLFEQFQQTGQTPDGFMYNTVISACDKGAQWEKALKVLAIMKENGHKIDHITYGGCISACAKGKEWKQAQRLLFMMRSEGIQPTVDTFTAYIQACAKNGEFEKALDILEDMKSTPIEPSIVIFNSCISACTKAREWAWALKLMQLMKQDGVKPDFYTYTACLTACEMGGEWKRSIRLLKELKAEGFYPNVFVYNSIMGACEKHGLLKKALKVLEKMEADSVKPDIQSYTSLIIVATKRRDFHKVQEFWEIVRKREKMKLTESICLAMIEAYEAGDATEKAEKLRKRMKSMTFDEEPDIYRKKRVNKNE